MSLADLVLQKEYRNLKCDVISEFYIPILREAILYKRAVGFFNSSALYEMAIGLKELVRNNGKIRLIVSPQLTQEDIESIRLGYRERNRVIEDAILKSISEPSNSKEKRKLNLLANLIADNILDIKVAFKIDAGAVGIFHEKIGIIEDFYGNKVAFTGSMNETYSGLLLNYESIDVFCSWLAEDFERVKIKEKAFDNLWMNLDGAIEVLDFPKVAIERLSQYKIEETDKILEKADIDERPVVETKQNDLENYFHIPNDVKLHGYQKEAIATWMDKNGRGIFDMATGTGKTYTGLGALCALSLKLHHRLGVVIVCPYQHLVEQWVEDIERFGVKPLICYSRYDWKRRFKDTLRDYKLKILDRFCFITTNATFSMQFMQDELKKMKGDICLVVDEAHNFGAKKQLACMSEVYNYRLALSATLERHHDEEGTAKLYQYFGDKCIEYPLSRAIAEDKLTPYYYYPIPVYFEENELDRYVEITEKIVSILRKCPNRKSDELPQAAERLLIERARIIAGANGKVEALRETIIPYKKSTHLLVYCGATKVLAEEESEESVDLVELRQIDAVTKMLGNELGMTVTQFTAAEDSEQREVIKSEFSNEKIQALVAIKCLDEGMNIPGIEVAFILASSTNPKEYIQRRGRVLRKAKGKQFAKIYDFVVIPRPFDESIPLYSKQAELSLIKREVERMKDFQALSENPSDVSELIRLLTDKYKIYEIGEDYERL